MDISEIRFEDLDDYFQMLPQDISKIIFNYYTQSCKECGTVQKYCIGCKKYQCFCVKDIFHCNVKICDRLLCCEDGILICTCCTGLERRYLCERCYRIDIHDEIVEDIRINGR